MKHLITAIVEINTRKSKVVLDYEEELALYKGELRRFNIQEGDVMPDKVYEEIMTEILPKRARERCLNLLAQRSMTEWEVRKKLRDGYYPECIIGNVIALLQKHHLLDDADYADSYIRMKKSAKSKRQIEQDLARKGVSQDTIRNTLSGCGVDEEHNIHVLMQKKKIDPECSTQEELHKFAAFLFRKGYDYDLIRKVVFR